MQSIYQQALGADFHKLHPKIQERFGLCSRDRRASIGVGIMHKMVRGPAWAGAFLRVGAMRRVMFPECRDNIPFVVENYAYLDSLGRETVSWIRTFDFPARRRRFDAYMIFSKKRCALVDYLGTHQHQVVDLAISVAPNGGIQFVSGQQRIYEGPLNFRIPAALTATARVSEWFDDQLQKYRIKVDVENPHTGALFGYEGTFEATSISAVNPPPEILPQRLQAKE